MKKLLSLLLTAALIFSFSVPALAAKPASGTSTTSAKQTEGSEEEEAETEESEAEETLTGAIILLHTNDVHGSIEGYARVAAAKAKLEAAGAYVLLLDAGDYSQGTEAVSLSQGANAVELMNLAGYDAAALGSHEFDYGFENLKTRMESAEFAVLAANVRDGDEAAFAGSEIFTTEDGKKIGVFGLTGPETDDSEQSDETEDISILSGEDLYACAQEQVDALKDEDCDYIVCLGHLGIDEAAEDDGNRSIDLLENVTGIDVFIDGRSHLGYDEMLEATDGTGKVGDSYLTSAGTALEDLGIVVILDGEIAVKNVPLAELTDSDETVAARVQEMLEEAAAEEPEEAEEPVVQSASVVFTDVMAGAWYEEFVDYVYQNGLMTGVSDDTFDLTGEVNTQTLVTVLYRLAGQPAVEGDLSAYEDGDSVAAWAQDAMIWATRNGIVTGTGTQLEPTAAASRERVATILYRYLGSPAAEDADLSAYTDADEISSWARTAMEWANVSGIITGSTQTTLNPAAGTTRAAMAKILTVFSALDAQ